MDVLLFREVLLSREWVRHASSGEMGVHFNQHVDQVTGPQVSVQYGAAIISRAIFKSLPAHRSSLRVVEVDHTLV